MGVNGGEPAVRQREWPSARSQSIRLCVVNHPRHPGFVAVLVPGLCQWSPAAKGQHTGAPHPPPTTYHTAFSSFVGVGFVPGIGSVHGPTPVDASVEIGPQAQSMDREIVADRV